MQSNGFGEKHLIKITIIYSSTEKANHEKRRFYVNI